MSWRPASNQLRGRVAVVAGATRGAGRGIAAALGEAGATVICTGRSSRRGGLASDYQRPETIEETADLVTCLGGKGVPFAVDHLDTEQVAALANQLGRRYGHIDILVNDIWGAERLKGGPAQWNTPIWEHDLHAGLRILRLGVDTHLITSHYLLPLLVKQPGGLLVEVTDGTTEYQQSLTGGQLSRVYGFTDIDGSQPDVWTHITGTPANRDDSARVSFSAIRPPAPNPGRVMGSKSARPLYAGPDTAEDRVI